MGGVPPKPPDQRARTNKDPIPLRVIHAEPETQPDLPNVLDWHPMTLRWWSMWGESPLSEKFTANDWSELIDTAVLHHRYWNAPSTQLAAELRLRAANFGATPVDRAKLRIQFATAGEIEEKSKARATSPQSARARYAPPSRTG